MGKYYMISDEPVLEIGSWKLLGPDNHGIKAGQVKPLLIHKCPKEFSQIARKGGDEEIRYADLNYTAPDRLEGRPKCRLCYDPIPEEIQGLLAMYHWDKE